MSRLSATRVTSDTSAPPCTRCCRLAATPSLSSCPICRIPPRFSPNCWNSGKKEFPSSLPSSIRAGNRRRCSSIRKLFYRLVNRLSDDIETYENFTGFGLYDRQVIDLVRQFGDPYPYFRGMIAEIGLPHAEVLYEQQRRKSGKSKNNFYTLYDLAMLGITKLSKVPLRLVTFSGFAGSLLSMLGGTGYFAYKLMFWQQFTLGIAPIAIGMFFLGSLQLLFMGIIGEYIGNIHTQVHNRPLVVERERLNFQYEPGEPLPRSALASGAATGQ